MEYRRISDSLVVSLRSELALKDSIIAAQSGIITKYESRVIPGLRSEIDLVKELGENDSKMLELKIRETEIRLEKAKRRRFGLSVFAGAGFATTGVVEPVIGAGVSYNLLKF